MSEFSDAIKSQIEKDRNFIMGRLRKFNERDLKDRLYAVLSELHEFRNLSMDRQGEMCVALAKVLNHEAPYFKVVLDGVVDDPILKVDEWDCENDKVGC
jgi:hypothetical protein